MKSLFSERTSALSIRPRKSTKLNAARVNWRGISVQLVSLLLTYALLLQLVPRVANAAQPQPRNASPVAKGALATENANSTLNSLFSGATGAISSPNVSAPLPTPPGPELGNGIAIVRHSPSLNGNGRVEGSVRQLTGENVTLNGGAVITNDLQVPGVPTLLLNGNPTFGGTIQGTGSSQPTNYQVTLNGATATLGHLATRNDPISLASVGAPPASQGTRNVTIGSICNSHPVE